MQLSEPGAGAVIAAGTAVGVIIDDESSGPVVTVSGGSGVTEGAAAVFTISASPVPATALAVGLAVVDAAGSPDQGIATYAVVTAGGDGETADEPDGAVTVEAGLGLDLSGRTLVAHDEDDLKNRGLAVSFTLDPDPASARGLSLTFGHAFGGPADGVLTRCSGPTRWLATRAPGKPAAAGTRRRHTGSRPSRGASSAVHMSVSTLPRIPATSPSAGPHAGPQRNRLLPRGRGDQTHDRRRVGGTHARPRGLRALVDVRLATA